MFSYCNNAYVTSLCMCVCVCVRARAYVYTCIFQNFCALNKISVKSHNHSHVRHVKTFIPII